LKTVRGKAKANPPSKETLEVPKEKAKVHPHLEIWVKAKYFLPWQVNLTLPQEFRPTRLLYVDFATKLGTLPKIVGKRTALHSNILYQQTRSKFSGRQQLLFAGLENSVFSPDACSWCLQFHCDGSNCTPPEEPLFFTQTYNAFCEETLPLVKNAKLELPVGSNEPLSPQYTNEQSTYIFDINNDNDYNQYHYPQQYKGDEE
jgi:hypothetical protein